ncbi:MAG: GTP-binding protein [Lutibacter sp.]|nr:GTP-binding protein [Lutibacter sp.]
MIEKNSELHLRPRFKLHFNESQQKLITKFQSNVKNTNCNYCVKVIDGHIVIDIPAEENHFWSPQLHIEIEQVKENKSIVKGLFGPKPQVWIFFMFIHFVMAIAFIGFSIMAYVKRTLKSDYKMALIITFVLPILWIVMYFLGRLGKKRGHQQMDELHGFMMETLNKKV